MAKKFWSDKELRHWTDEKYFQILGDNNYHLPDVQFNQSFVEYILPFIMNFIENEKIDRINIRALIYTILSNWELRHEMKHRVEYFWEFQIKKPELIRNKDSKVIPLFDRDPP